MKSQLLSANFGQKRSNRLEVGSSTRKCAWPHGDGLCGPDLQRSGGFQVERSGGVFLLLDLVSFLLEEERNLVTEGPPSECSPFWAIHPVFTLLKLVTIRGKLPVHPRTVPRCLHQERHHDVARQKRGHETTLAAQLLRNYPHHGVSSERRMSRKRGKRPQNSIVEQFSYFCSFFSKTNFCRGRQNQHCS